MDDTEKKGAIETKHTLSDDEIVTQKPMARRSAMTSLGLGIIGALGLAVGLKPSTALADGCTDSDGGPYADGAGEGRRCRRYYRPVVVVRNRGCTDSDGGPYADGGGQGRRCGGYVVPVRQSCTDNDSGGYADAAGNGRHCGYY